MNLELLIIITVISIQVYVFIRTFLRIEKLKKYFSSKEKIKIKNKKVKFSEGSSEEMTIDYISINDDSSNEFNENVSSINSYLGKNKGSAADFNIIKDITERHIDSIINGINSTVSTPLFLGLAGTFFGVIYGLSFLDFPVDENGISVISTESLGLLINGIITAMVASAAGLILTLVNSAFFYKNALYKNEQDKNKFYDFIQSELLPKLSRDVSDSLGNLKSNLDHFNNKFGENLVSYKDSFSLLNENLKMEKDFLDAVQQVGLNKLSNQIVKTFEQVNKSTNDFHDFQKYQEGLNSNMNASISILKQYNKVTSDFGNFNNNLNLVSEHIIESSDFYHQFKTFLESHFSEVEVRKNAFTNSIDVIDSALTNKLKELSSKTIDQKDFYNEQWRKTVDILNQDIVNLFSKLSDYVEAEADSLKSYISAEEHGLQKIFESNKEFFKDFRYVEQLFTKFSSYAEISHIHQQNIESGLEVVTKLLSDDASLINVNKNLVEIKIAIEKLAMSISESKKE
ncbi:hypothetical protein V6246_00625 [Algibacter sp. TI.3.09]|uniref:hypothetical protein n=1 Tax=Algibacter sp. TI.3.09 TaxID=3121298 RepID=UPI00311E1E19